MPQSFLTPPSCPVAFPGGGDDRRSRAVLFLAMLLAMALAAAPTAARQTAATSTRAAGEVLIEVDRFGAGNQARPGDWCGLRLRLTDTASSQRELIVRVQTVDADGDQPLYQTGLTSNPGLAQQAWLYARLPFVGTAEATEVTVTVHEAVEAGDLGEPGATGYRAGRMLASAKVTPKAGSIVPATVGMIGVVGPRPLGLQQYGDRAGPSSPWHPFANESTQIVTGLTPEDMPDRWMGLAGFEAVVWADGDPAKLRGDRARAVRDYVTRGGHLIIILPPVGQTWTNASSNELIDIMPSVTVASRERVPFEGFRPLLTSWNTTSFPATATVQQFTRRPDTSPWEASCVLAGPEGGCVVTRREVGAGCVTMVGLDLNQTALSQFRMIDAEVFWHRVLGRRGTLQEPQVEPSADGSSTVQVAAGASRRVVSYDAMIDAAIGKSGSSATGVLAGFVVFAIYWAVAGPVGFALLRRRGMTHHAWVGFIACSVVFTVFAWGGATILRPKATEATHLTLLDHVFGQPVQRARTWASVLLPWYGSATLGVGEAIELKDRSAQRRSLNSIAAWEAADASASGFGGFPDARGYAVDARLPDTITVPTRQTVKQVEAQWSGGPRWEMPLPLPDEGKEGMGVLRLNDAGWFQLDETKQVPLVTGSLVHKFPGPMTGVTVIVVRRQQPLPAPRPRTAAAALPAALPCEAEAFVFTEPWEPGKPLSLDVVTRPRSRVEQRKASLDQYLATLVPAAGFGRVLDEGEATRLRPASALAGLALFPMLPTPEPSGDIAAPSPAVPQRTSTHGFDLGRWFTRPCIIIVGMVGEQQPQPSPVPLVVDGEPLETMG
ncbi:MAG: hypothetical protein RL689_2319, partial [Planctomycetota bacterium]